MNTNTNKVPYEAPIVEVLYFQTSGSILYASGEGFTTNPLDPGISSSSSPISSDFFTGEEIMF